MSLHVGITPAGKPGESLVRVYEGTGIHVESWDRDTLLIAFDGLVQKHVVVLDGADFERFSDEMRLVTEQRADEARAEAREAAARWGELA